VLGFRTQTMEAHELQSAGTREQISLLLQGGHDGVSSGQVTQRLNTVRRVRSTSYWMLTERRVRGIEVEEDMAVPGVQEPRASRARNRGS
jgi:hypothetical protein